MGVRAGWGLALCSCASIVFLRIHRVVVSLALLGSEGQEGRGAPRGGCLLCVASR